MSLQTNHFYKFGSFRLDPEQRLLMHNGEVMPLTPKVFDTLLTLVESKGRIVDKEDLMSRIWPDSFVEEGNLTFNISTLRKALGKVSDEGSYIETIPRRGYRFVASVREVSDDPVDLIVKEHTRSRVVVEEEQEGRREAGARRPESGEAGTSLSPAPGQHWEQTAKTVVLAVLLLGIAVALAHLWISQQRTPPQTGEMVRSIAVLPFKPLGIEQDGEYLGPGIADALIIRLSHLGGLIVRPTSEVMKYKVTGQDSLAAGHELKVDALLKGSFQKSGERIRVTLHLLRVQDGATLWAERFDEKFSNIFAVEDSISEKVVHALALELTSRERKLLTKRYTENTEAHQLYLKGRYFWNKLTEEGFRKGIEYFNRAIEIDPNYALAYAGLADGYYGLSWEYSPPSEAMPKAKAAAMKALEIDEKLAEAHFSLALVKGMYEWDWLGSKTGFERAVELNPGYAPAYQYYGFHLGVMGRFEEANAAFKRAEELDPVSPYIVYSVGKMFFYERQYDRAIEQYEKALEIDPSLIAIKIHIARARLFKGELAQALPELHEARLSRNYYFETFAPLALAYVLSGKRDAARQLLDDLKKESTRTLVPSFNMAMICSILGEKDEAFKWLEKAYEHREASMVALRLMPELDGLRSDPRFLVLLKKMHLDD